MTKKSTKSAAVSASILKSPVKVMPPKPRGTGLLERYLDSCSAEFSESYVKSLQRPLTSFIEWCASKGVTRMSQVQTETLVRYRRHVEKQGRALSTTRMELARVQTFLRFAESSADLAVLRLPHTEQEKAHLAALAEERAEAAEQAPKARKSGKAA